MFAPSLTFVLAAIALPLAVTATHVSRQETSATIFNTPILTHFLHLEALTSWPVNVSAVDGIRGRYPNVGGNTTGGITGKVVNIGAAEEWFPVLLNAGDAKSFYTNQWTINATIPTNTTSSSYPILPIPEYATILVSATAHLTYANEFLHGFGPVTFSSSHPAFLDLNWRSFYAEIEAGFRTGSAKVDVFEAKTGGKRDGSPIKALLPPGAEA